MFSTAFVGEVSSIAALMPFQCIPLKPYACIRLDKGGTAANQGEPVVVCQSSGVCRVF